MDLYLLNMVGMDVNVKYRSTLCRKAMKVRENSFVLIACNLQNLFPKYIRDISRKDVIYFKRKFEKTFIFQIYFIVMCVDKTRIKYFGLSEIFLTKMTSYRVWTVINLSGKGYPFQLCSSSVAEARRMLHRMA